MPSHVFPRWNREYNMHAANVNRANCATQWLHVTLDHKAGLIHGCSLSEPRFLLQGVLREHLTHGQIFFTEVSEADVDRKFRTIL